MRITSPNLADSFKKRKWNRIFKFGRKRWIKIGLSTLILAGAVGIITILIINFSKPSSISQSVFQQDQVAAQIETPENNVKPLPPPSMNDIKTKGCVTDGFLSGYGGTGNTDRMVTIINRSECQYLHRALETWLEPPDFKLAQKIKSKITKEGMVYGMFIAEAIDTKANYYYPAEHRNFDFAKMCREGSNNFWGEHTCKPSLESGEYRKYLRYITEQAIDSGIQSFMFGQVFYQDASDLSKSRMPEVIKNMREYAAFRGTGVVIGAQTNDITDENYLRLFDYIEGGVGLHSDGTVESGPCFSRWWQQPGDWCWALLWNKQYSSKANNVLLHLDWSGKVGDDMSTFARMDDNLRKKTLKSLYTFFTSQNMGFLVPVLTPLPLGNDGCYGRKERYYSPDDKYSCKDEGVINDILKGK